MVIIANKNLELSKLNKKDFSSAENSFISYCKFIKEESLIYVEEIIENTIYCTFFNSENLDIISKDNRYKAFNGKKNIFKKNGYDLIIEISVDKKTGLEKIHESVTKNGDTLYKSTSIRYQEKETTPLWDRYLKSVETKNKREESYNNYMKDFYNAPYNMKLKLLRTEFNKKRKTRWEMGFEPIEQVFLKDQLIDYDKDSEFRKALREILIGEEAIMGKSEEDIYNTILEPLFS